MTWQLLDGTWTLFAGERRVNRLRWVPAKGCYEDRDGVPMGRKFEDAQAACEKAVKAK